MAVILPKAAYEWSLKHLLTDGDTDLFPPPFEFLAIKKHWNDLLPKLARLDLSQYTWSSGRRFQVPKSPYSYRFCTQLEPLDSLVLAALIWKLGKKLESTRIPLSDKLVFSNRFAPSKEGRFYTLNTWRSFWEKALEESRDTLFVVKTDVVDYYNQIYHHVLENQISSSGVDSDTLKILKNMLQAVSHKVSRGVPVGPYSTHILAECAFNDIDRSLRSHGYKFCRYIDDTFIFCDSEDACTIALHDLSRILDQQQRLTLHSMKTEVLTSERFRQIARQAIEDTSIESFIGQELIGIIHDRTDDDPYARVPLESLAPSERGTFTKDSVEGVLEESWTEDPSLKHMGWLLRRFAQLGVPEAIEFVVRNLESLLPIIADVSRYLCAAVPNFDNAVPNLGLQIIEAFEIPLVQKNDYLQLILLHMFHKVPALNQSDKLLERYETSSPFVRRGIVLATMSAKNAHWLRERKDEFATADPWLRRAIISASSSLPRDEREFWMKHIKKSLNGMEEIVRAWASKDRLSGSISFP